MAQFVLIQILSLDQRCTVLPSNEMCNFLQRTELLVHSSFQIKANCSNFGPSQHVFMLPDSHFTSGPTATGRESHFRHRRWLGPRAGPSRSRWLRHPPSGPQAFPREAVASRVFLAGRGTRPSLAPWFDSAPRKLSHNAVVTLTSSARMLGRLWRTGCCSAHGEDSGGRAGDETGEARPTLPVMRGREAADRGAPCTGARARTCARPLLVLPHPSARPGACWVCLPDEAPGSGGRLWQHRVGGLSPEPTV